MSMDQNMHAPNGARPGERKPPLDELIRRAKEKLEAAEKARRESSHTNKYEKEIKTMPISDLSHFGNHLNYLFRTDAGQKWTNELTGENRYAFCFPSDAQFAFLTAQEPGERRSFKEMVSKGVEARAKALGISKNDFCRTLIQIRTDYRDRETKFTDLVEKDTKALLMTIEKEMPGKELLCSVVHTDQKDCMLHAHFLLCDKQEKEKGGEEQSGSERSLEKAKK